MCECVCVLTLYFHTLHPGREHECCHTYPHTLGTYDLTWSTHKQSVGAYTHQYSQRAWFRPWLKCRVYTQTAWLEWYASSQWWSTRLRNVSFSLLCWMKMHSFQFPTKANINFYILIFAKDWIWVVDSLKLSLQQVSNPINVVKRYLSPKHIYHISLVLVLFYVRIGDIILWNFVYN